MSEPAKYRYVGGDHWGYLTDGKGTALVYGTPKDLRQQCPDADDYPSPVKAAEPEKVKKPRKPRKSKDMPEQQEAA